MVQTRKGMSVWGCSTFQNDVALDLLEDWIDDNDPIKTMTRALDRALEQPVLGEVEGHCVSAIATILDCALVTSVPEEEIEVEGWSIWLEALGNTALKPLLPPTLEALDRVLAPESGLCRRWSTDPAGYKCWRQALRTRKNRLTVFLASHQAPFTQTT